MINEPFFIANEFLEKDLPELEKILETLKGPKFKNPHRAVFLRSFTNKLFQAYRKQKSKSVKEEKLQTKEFQKLKLEKRKYELLTKIKEVKELKQTQQPLIYSELTKKPLVKTGFTGSLYIITEPKLTEEENEILSKLDTKLDDKLLKLKIQELSKNFTNEQFDNIRYYFIRNKKYGIISPLIEDNKITEIICNSSQQPVLVSYKNKEVPTNIIFSTDEELNNFIRNLAQQNNIKITEENPFLNFKIKDFEVQATLQTEHIKPRFILVRSM